MAYRKRTTRKSSRRSYSGRRYSRKPAKRRSGGVRRRRASTSRKRTGSRQRITLVIKHEPPTSGMNAPILGVEAAPQAIRKAKF